MSTKIGLINDIHATAVPLRKALTIFAQENVDLILCLGDIAGYETELGQSIELLVDTGCITILSNHDVWHIDRNTGEQEKWVERFFNNLPVTWELTLEGIRIFAVHPLQ